MDYANIVAARLGRKVLSVKEIGSVDETASTPDAIAAAAAKRLFPAHGDAPVSLIETQEGWVVGGEHQLLVMQPAPRLVPVADESARPNRYFKTGDKLLVQRTAAGLLKSLPANDIKTGRKTVTAKEDGFVGGLDVYYGDLDGEEVAFYGFNIVAVNGRKFDAAGDKEEPEANEANLNEITFKEGMKVQADGYDGVGTIKGQDGKPWKKRVEGIDVYRVVFSDQTAHYIEQGDLQVEGTTPNPRAGKIVVVNSNVAECVSILESANVPARKVSVAVLESGAVALTVPAKAAALLRSRLPEVVEVTGNFEYEDDDDEFPLLPGDPHNQGDDKTAPNESVVEGSDVIAEIRRVAKRAAKFRLAGKMQAAGQADRELDKLHKQAEKAGLADDAVEADEEGRESARTDESVTEAVKVQRHGSGSYSVTLDADAVSAWTADWPGSHLEGPVTFTFDAKNGDLVDMEPNDMDGEDSTALSHDAGYIGAKRLKLTAAMNHNGRFADKGKAEMLESLSERQEEDDYDPRDPYNPDPNAPTATKAQDHNESVTEAVTKIDGETPAVYAGQWGSTDDDGRYFYNYGSSKIKKDREFYRGFIKAIERQIEDVTQNMKKGGWTEEDVTNLRKLLQHVTVEARSVKESIDEADAADDVEISDADDAAVEEAKRSFDIGDVVALKGDEDQHGKVIQLLPGGVVRVEYDGGSKQIDAKAREWVKVDEAAIEEAKRKRKAKQAPVKGGECDPLNAPGTMKGGRVRVKAESVVFVPTEQAAAFAEAVAEEDADIDVAFTPVDGGIRLSLPSDIAERVVKTVTGCQLETASK